MRPAHELTPWLDGRGGVAHTTTLRSAGFTTHGIRAALSDGAVRWARRSWLAATDADPMLVRAASLGARLTCLTAARRHGLWVPEHGEVHLAVSPSSSRLSPDGCRVHWGIVPEPVALGALVDPIVNVLCHVAACVPLVDALCVWESALRKGAIPAGMLGAVPWRGNARRIAAEASSLSDSGLETRFVRLVSPLGVPVRQQVWIDGHPVDALVGERLVTQLDGFAHHRASDRRRDLRADARLTLLGYTVLRFDYAQILFHPQEVVATVSLALAQQRHLVAAR